MKRFSLRARTSASRSFSRSSSASSSASTVLSWEKIRTKSGMRTPGESQPLTVGSLKQSEGDTLANDRSARSCRTTSSTGLASVS